MFITFAINSYALQIWRQENRMVALSYWTSMCEIFHRILERKVFKTMYEKSWIEGEYVWLISRIGVNILREVLFLYIYLNDLITIYTIPSPYSQCFFIQKRHYLTREKCVEIAFGFYAFSSRMRNVRSFRNIYHH